MERGRKRRGGSGPVGDCRRDVTEVEVEGMIPSGVTQGLAGRPANSNRPETHRAGLGVAASSFFEITSGSGNSMPGGF